MPDLLGLATLVGVTLVAATVNGALGYGFSSMTVPVALIFLTNRVLNPAVVLVEVVLNSYALFVNRRSLASAWRRVFPIQLGLLLGVGAGSYVLFSLDPGWLKLWTYGLLLPLILVQAGGLRRPIRAERLVGVPFGAGVGLLYSLTTISGPPLALLFNNQGFSKEEFRAGLALVRVTESTLTAVAYASLGLYAPQSTRLLLLIVPSVAIGVPLGAHLIQRVDAETFRRVCMSFDAWIVGFGCSRVMLALGLLPSPAAYGVLLAVALIDGALLYNFFTRTGARRDGAATRDWSVRGRASLGPGDTPPVWVRETRHG
jgi:uncharacterized protein